MSRKHDIIMLHGQINAQTAAAYFFLQEDAENPVWLPKSQCEWNPEDNEMQLPEWLALEKGLI